MTKKNNSQTNSQTNQHIKSSSQKKEYIDQSYFFDQAIPEKKSYKRKYNGEINKIVIPDQNGNPQKILAKDFSGGGVVTKFNNFDIGYDEEDALLLGRGFPGFPLLGRFLENGVFNKMCSILALDMTNKWIKFKSMTDNEASLKKIVKLEKRFKQLNVKKIYYEAIYKNCAFGSIYIYPKITGDDIPHDNNVGTSDLQNELFLDPSKECHIEELRIIEPTVISVFPTNTIKPLGKYFYEPEYINVYTEKIHSSRLIKLVYSEVSNIDKPIYNYGGISLIQLALEYVLRFEKASANITDLTGRMNLDILYTNMNAIVAGSSNQGDYQSLKNRVEFYTALKDTRGVAILDKNTELFEKLQISLNNLAELQTKAAEFMTMITHMPLSRFLGTSPGGLNPSTDNEVRNYYDYLSSQRENKIRPGLEKLMHLIMIDEDGEIDEDIVIEFENLWETNKLEESQIALNKAQERGSYQDRGNVSAQEIREILINQPDGEYTHLPTENDDLNQEIDDLENEEDTGEEPEEIIEK